MVIRTELLKPGLGFGPFGFTKITQLSPRDSAAGGLVPVRIALPTPRCILLLAIPFSVENVQHVFACNGEKSA